MTARSRRARRDVSWRGALRLLRFARWPRGVGWWRVIGKGEFPLAVAALVLPVAGLTLPFDRHALLVVRVIGPPLGVVLGLLSWRALCWAVSPLHEAIEEPHDRDDSASPE